MSKHIPYSLSHNAHEHAQIRNHISDIEYALKGYKNQVSTVVNEIEIEMEDELKDIHAAKSKIDIETKKYLDTLSKEIDVLTHEEDTHL